MSDENAVLDAPTNTPAPEANEPHVPSGIEGAMKEFEQAIAPKPKPETPAKEPEKATPKAEPKPEAKVDPKAPAPKAEDLWEKAPPKLKGEHYKTVRQLQDKADTLEKRIKEIESKKVETPADTKLVEQYQKQIKDLEQKIAASDYRQSQEFQKNFVARWQSEYKNTVAEVGQLMLTIKDAEGNEKQRPATEADFQKIMRLPPGEQDKVISELFGHYAPRVFTRLMRLQEIERASEEALSEHAANAEKTAKEKALEAQRSEGEYKTHYDASVAELEKGWPQYFAADDNDPDATTALQQGYKFVDDALANAANLKPDERAAKNAVIRARAAGFVRAIVENNRLKTELESLKTELSKFRKSDPGSAEGEHGGPAATGEEDVPAGIEAATKAFANLR